MDMNQQRQVEPAFNIPKPILVVLVVLALIYFGMNYLLTEAEFLEIQFLFAFIPLRYIIPLAGQGYEFLWSPITYSFLHGGPGHLFLNCVWLVVFATPVCRRIGVMRFALLWLVSAPIAAFANAIFNNWEASILIGASGVVSAYMGAACRFALTGYNVTEWDEDYNRKRLSIMQAVMDKRVALFAGVYLLINIVPAFMTAVFGMDTGNIAWDSHIAGFFVGFLFFGFFDRQNYQD